MELSSHKNTQSQVAIHSRVSWDIATKKFNFKYCRKLLNSNSDRVSILKPIKMQRKTTTCYKFLVLLYFCTIPQQAPKESGGGGDGIWYSSLGCVWGEESSKELKVKSLFWPVHTASHECDEAIEIVMRRRRRIDCRPEKKLAINKQNKKIKNSSPLSI